MLTSRLFDLPSAYSTEAEPSFHPTTLALALNNPKHRYTHRSSSSIPFWCILALPVPLSPANPSCPHYPLLFERRCGSVSRPRSRNSATCTAPQLRCPFFGNRGMRILASAELCSLEKASNPHIPTKVVIPLGADMCMWKVTAPEAARLSRSARASSMVNVVGKKGRYLRVTGFVRSLAMSSSSVALGGTSATRPEGDRRIIWCSTGSWSIREEGGGGGTSETEEAGSRAPS